MAFPLPTVRFAHLFFWLRARGVYTSGMLTLRQFVTCRSAFDFSGRRFRIRYENANQTPINSNQLIIGISLVGCASSLFRSVAYQARRLHQAFLGS